MKNLYLSFIALFFAVKGISQSSNQTFSALDVLNYKKQGTINYPAACKTDERHNFMKQNSLRYFLDYQQDLQNTTNPNYLMNKAGGILTIPVVVHIIHTGESEGVGANISDAQVYSAINNLNDAYRGVGYTTDMEIEFCLASQDPSGNPTTGINRVLGTGVSGYSTDGITDANEEDVKLLSRWDNTEYYNIWIVTEIDGNDGGSGTQGYAYMYESAGNKDGSVILYNSFGYDPNGDYCYSLKSYTNYNVTTIHELGHAFGLYHTFQGDGTGSTCPPASTAGTGDLCADTPSHKRGDGDCGDSGSTCSGDVLEDVVDNIMAYSSDYCQVTFTADQKTRARNHINTYRPGLLTSSGCTPVAAPVSDFETCVVSGCEGQTIEFYDVSSASPISWSWDVDGDGTFDYTTQNPSHTYTAAGTYTVTLIATNSIGTGNTETKTNYITITESAASACAINLTNSGYYAYAISNVTLGDIDNFSDVYDNGYNDYSCSNTTTLTPGNTYDLNISVGTGGGTATQDAVYGVYIDFDNSGTFDLPDELVANGTNTAGTGYNDETHSITMPANPTLNTLLRMRVINDQASLSGPCHTLWTGEAEDYGIVFEVAGPAPTADFSGSQTTICAGESVSFTDASTDSPTSWSWNFGDGGSSTSQNPSYTYNTAGTYSVQLTATNSNGSDAISKTNYITVNELPDVSSTSSTAESCTGNDGTATVSPTGGAGVYTYAWDASAGSQVVQTALLLASGTYGVTVTDVPNGCSASTSVTVSNSCTPAPVADFSGSPTTICAGESVTFSDASTNFPTSWTWDFGDGGSSTAQNVGHTYSSAGTYTVTLTATNAGGSDVMEKVGYVTVNSLEDASFSYGVTTYCMQDADPSPSVTGVGGGTFTSSPLGLSIDGSSGVIDLSASNSGTYTVTYNTSGTCAGSSDFDVTIDPCTPTTQLKLGSCGATLSSMTQLIYADYVYQAEMYEYQFTNTVTSQVYTAQRFYAKVTLQHLGISELGATFDVQVKVKYNGTWGAFGPVCQVTTPSNVPNTKLRSGSCGASLVSFGQNIYADYVSGATHYEYEFTNTSTSQVTTKVRSYPKVTLQQVGLGGSYDQVYDVRVRARIGGQWGNFSTVCSLTGPASSLIVINDDPTQSVEKTTIYAFAGEDHYGDNTFEINAYPNPFNDNLTVEFGNDLEKEITIYNALGQVMMNANTSDDRMILDVNTYLPGVYLMKVTAGEESKIVRLIKQ